MSINIHNTKNVKDNMVNKMHNKVDDIYVNR